MSNEQTIDGVPRELLVRLCNFHATGWEDIEPEIKELGALLDAPASCAHEWTDDGAHILVCTACGAQEDHDPGWRDMATAPTDGTMVRLLVEFKEHSTEDAEQAPTIGANNFDNDEEDVWRFAGWCWSHDHFTEGKGTPVGWLPMLDDPVSKPAAQPQGEPVAWRGMNADGEEVTDWIDGVPPVRMTDLCGNPASFASIQLAYAKQPAPVAIYGGDQ